MSHFTDLHIHALYGVDDGARTKEDMLALVQHVYQQGTRYLCVTPHFHPGFFPKSTREATDAVFAELQAYAQHNLPDLHLAIGNELRYSKDCISWLNDGFCRTLNGTDYVLVDFLEDEEAPVIIRAMDQLMNAGYIPVLAHMERYRKLSRSLKELKQFADNGVILQMNASSVCGEQGFFKKEYCKKLIKHHLVDFVSSDAHNLAARPPQMQQAYTMLQKTAGLQAADYLCSRHGRSLLWDL